MPAATHRKGRTCGRGAGTAESCPMAVDTGWKGLFRDAFKSSRNAMVLLDDQRRHIEGNGAYVKLLGYSPRELAGRHVYEFVDGGPLKTEREWQALMHQDQFADNAVLIAK